MSGRLRELDQFVATVMRHRKLGTRWLVAAVGAAVTDIAWNLATFPEEPWPHTLLVALLGVSAINSAGHFGYSHGYTDGAVVVTPAQEETANG